MLSGFDGTGMRCTTLMTSTVQEIVHMQFSFLVKYNHEALTVTLSGANQLRGGHLYEEKFLSLTQVACCHCYVALDVSAVFLGPVWFGSAP